MTDQYQQWLAQVNPELREAIENDKRELRELHRHGSLPQYLLPRQPTDEELDDQDRRYRLEEQLREAVFARRVLSGKLHTLQQVREIYTRCQDWTTAIEAAESLLERAENDSNRTMARLRAELKGDTR